MIRTTEPGDPPQDPRGGCVPRWQIGVDAHQRENQIRHRQRLVHPTLPGHVPTSTTPYKERTENAHRRQNPKCARTRALPLYAPLKPHTVTGYHEHREIAAHRIRT
jgi:hypothetical protein